MRFICEVCGKDFTNMSNLYRHRKSHGSAEVFRCQICGISIKRKDNFLRHCNDMHIVEVDEGT